MYYETWIPTIKYSHVSANEQMATGKIPYSNDTVSCYIIWMAHNVDDQLFSSGC